MICQLCSTANSDEADYCQRCGHKLLVVSGEYTEEDQDAFDDAVEETMSLDEHLLERVSILEEVVRRTARSMRQILGTLYKLEQKILMNQTGMTSLRDLLEDKRVIGREEWSELWEERADQHLLALEKRERFQQVRDRIAGLYSGQRRELFASLLGQAEMALAGLDIEGAVEALGEAHQLDPSNYELAFFLGETCFNEGRLGDALRFFTRVLAVKPRHFESLVYSGVLCHEKGRGDRATQLLEQAVSLYPDAFLPAFSLGAVQASRGRVTKAIVNLEKAIATGDSLPQASFLLGSCYYELDRIGVAIKNLESAVDQDPSFEEAHVLLGLSYLDRGWHKKALATFRVVERLQPSRLDYHELVQFLGSPDNTLSTVGEAVVPALREAEEALRAGRGRQAISAYRRALSLEPENPTLLVAYAMACSALGRPEEVEPVVAKVLELSPGEPFEASACATWIETLRDHGRLRESRRLAETLLDRSDGGFASSIATFEMASTLAETEEELDLALSCVCQAAESMPEELLQFALAERGWIHFKRRELELAVTYLQESKALGTSARTLIRLGIALLAAGDLKQAQGILEEARSLESGRGGLQITVLEALKDGARLLQDGSLGVDA